MKSKILGLLAVGLLACAGTSQATSLIDQNNPSPSQNPGSFCAMLASDLCGQSFQQSNSNISGAGIYLAPNYPGSGTVTISIYQTYGSTPSGLVATGTSSVVNEGAGWVDVFWAPVAITPLTTYFMVLSNTSTLFAQMDAGGQYNGQYALGGALFRGSVFAFNYDLAFRTYHDATTGVPEPGSLLLLGLGLAGLGFGRRRKAN